MNLYICVVAAALGLFTVSGYAKHPLVIDSQSKIYSINGQWYYATSEPNNTKKNSKPSRWFMVDNLPKTNIKNSFQSQSNIDHIWYRISIILIQNSQYAITISNYYPGISIYLNGTMIYEIKEPIQHNPQPEKIRNNEIINIPCIIIKAGTNILMLRTVPHNTLNLLKKNIHFGDRELIKKKWLLTFIWDSALITICFFLSLYFLFFFLTKSRNNFYLYFSILAFSLGIWAFSYKGIFFYLFSDLEIYFLFRYVGSIFCVYFSIIFIIAFLQLKRGLDLIIFKIIYLFFCLSILLELLITGNIIYFKKYLYTPYMLVNTLTIFYAYFLCIKGILEYKKFAKIIFIGIVIFSILILSMIIGFFSILPENSYVLEGFFTLTIFYTIALASHYTKVQNEIEKINDDLIKLDKQKDFILAKLDMYEHIVSTSHDHMAFIDTNLRLLATNTSFMDAFAAKRVYIINKNIETIYGKNEFSKKLLEQCAICLNGKETFFEKEYTFPLLGPRYMSTYLIPYYEKNSTSISGIVLNSRDITERVLFENKIVNLAHEERRKIGMQLHDDISQILAGIKLKISVLSDKLQKENPALTEKTIEIEKQIEKSITATKNIAKGLFPINIDRAGLAPYLDDFTQMAEKNNISLSMSIDESIKINDMMITMHLYYIILESITNTIKHANASHIAIDFYNDNEHVVLSIKDNGIGMKKKSDDNVGIGITILKYRARMIGGNFAIQNLPEGGVHITCKLKV